MNTTHSTPTYDTHQRAKTPFEILREDYFNSLLEDEMKWCRNLDDVGKYTYLNQTMIKPQSIVNFSTRYQRRRYNAKSLDNLVQNQDKSIEKELKVIKTQEKIENINEWSNEYVTAYEENKGKKYQGLPSKQVANKIYRTASVFVRSILSGFESVRGFGQRSVTFCTFTITEPQKHSDTELIKTFVDFIDHLKKVNNYIIDPVTKERTKKKALIIENYLWRAETQENGNIHFHLIADTFLNQDMLRRVWNNYLQGLGYKYGYGAANVNSLKRDKKNNKIGNVERYLCKYMTKPPLRNAYKHLKSKDLEGISDVEKYRRPIIGKQWGCSRKLLKLEYPKFYDKSAKEIVRKLKDKLREVKSDNLPEYISVYVGDTRKAFATLDYKIQRQLKEHYLMCLHWLYDEVPCLN